ncbi:uncharacterized protein G2W53_018479 [Senna tora]|uniref:Uncharacterized protein n=1 Tax=Senna tora TaxID=362788 RepID=A0A834WL42_9FABA|nr:uncharacterized protein G2W53_018479 [Senna tora]
MSEKPVKFASHNPILGNQDQEVGNAPKRKVEERKEELNLLEEQKKKYQKQAKEAEHTYVIIKKEAEEMKRKSAMPSKNDKLKRDNQILVKQVDQLTRENRSHEVRVQVFRREYEARQNRIIELERRVAEQGQHLANINENKESVRLLPEAWKGPETVIERHLEIKRLKKKTEVVKKIEKMAQLMNMSTPRLIEVFKEAE